MVNINGVNIELVRRGKGRPILFLHPHIGLHGSDAFIARLAEHAEVIVPSHPGYGNSDLPAGMSKLNARLHRIRVPALFLWGEADRFAPVEYGDAYSKLIPGARFELVKDAGHFPHIEQAERVARRIVEEMK